jgi:FkbM family methyltransferase
MMKNLSWLEIIYSTTERALFSQSPGIYRSIYSVYKAITDRGERQLYRSLIKPGMIVVDIGANIGIYTHFFSQLIGENGKVHAFEPDPTNFRLLSKALSRHKNIFLNQSAISDKTENLSLYVSSSMNVDHRTYDCGDKRNKISVRSTTLDDYFLKGQHVDFIKIDIQGYEYHALSGMKGILGENEQVKLILEYYPSGLKAAGYSGHELRTFLIERKFSLYMITNKGRLVRLNNEEPRLNSMGYTNLFAARN